MSGNDRRAIIVQERDRRLLRELPILRVIDREQAKLVAGFHSTTRANVRLLGLTRAGFLKRFFLGTAAAGRKALYSLSAKGAELVQVPLRGPRRRKDETLVADFFIEHQLTVNRLYCQLKFSPIPIPSVTFLAWKSFDQPIVEGLHLIPDGYVELATSSGPITAFVEVDLGHESLRIWKDKIRNYLQLAMSGEYGRRFARNHFRVCVIAQSERRAHSIRKVVAPLTEKLFWFASIDCVEEKGFFSSVWFRPRGEEQQGFIQTL
jgi:protein involved in plasmid replication-relaxation